MIEKKWYWNIWDEVLLSTFPIGNEGPGLNELVIGGLRRGQLSLQGLDAPGRVAKVAVYDIYIYNIDPDCFNMFFPTHNGRNYLSKFCFC